MAERDADLVFEHANFRPADFSADQLKQILATAAACMPNQLRCNNAQANQALAQSLVKVAKSREEVTTRVWVGGGCAKGGDDMELCSDPTPRFESKTVSRDLLVFLPASKR